MTFVWCGISSSLLSFFGYLSVDSLVGLLLPGLGFTWIYPDSQKDSEGDAERGSDQWGLDEAWYLAGSKPRALMQILYTRMDFYMMTLCMGFLPLALDWRLVHIPGQASDLAWWKAVFFTLILRGVLQAHDTSPIDPLLSLTLRKRVSSIRLGSCLRRSILDVQCNCCSHLPLKLENAVGSLGYYKWSRGANPYIRRKLCTDFQKRT